MVLSNAGVIYTYKGTAQTQKIVHGIGYFKGDMRGECLKPPTVSAQSTVHNFEEVITPTPVPPYQPKIYLKLNFFGIQYLIVQLLEKHFFSRCQSGLH